jgi:two-component system KDP operon response regulator KdpE
VLSNTVLVVDTERMSRRMTTTAARYGGFDIEIARNAREASRFLRRQRFVALIVDPGFELDAPNVVKQLRALTEAPIIVVSAHRDTAHKILVLDAGADDYLTRPFDPEELLARMRAVIRRVVELEEDPPIVTPDFTVYVQDRRLVRADGAEPTLSPTEWRIIEVLVEHANHLVTREDLLTSVWGPDAVDKPQYLRVHMASIRQKVEPDPPHPQYFLTIPGLGLKFMRSPHTAESAGM